MIYRLASLELFNDALKQMLLNSFFNKQQPMVVLSFLGNIFCMFLLFSIVSVLYQQHLSKWRLIGASIICAFFYTAPIFFCVGFFYIEIFSINITFWLSMYPPYFIFILYFVFVYIMGINRLRCLNIIIHCYYFIITQILVYLFYDTLCFYLFTQDRVYENVIYNMANILTYITLFIMYIYFIQYMNKHKFWFAEYILNANQKVFPAIFYSFLKSSWTYFVITEVLFYVCLKLDVKGVFFSLITLMMLVLWMNFGNVMHHRFAEVRKNLDTSNSLLAAQMKAISDFSGIKHDIANMLQVYQGYITLGDWENLKKYHESVYKLAAESSDRLTITEKIQQNPALYTTLLYKMDKAVQCGVLMRVSCVADASNLMIHPVDLSRVLGILLDNAIEEAMETEEKFVQFYTEPKQNGGFLISVSNATRGFIDTRKIFESHYTTKQCHQGIGLYELWLFAARLPGCSLNVEYANNTITFYFEIACMRKGKETAGLLRPYFGSMTDHKENREFPL